MGALFAIVGGFFGTPLGKEVAKWAMIGAAILGAYLYVDHRGYARCQAKWAASVERAKAAIKADDAAAAALAEKTDDELSAALAAELTKRQEKYDALVKAVDAAGCTVSDDDARRVRP